MDIVATGLDAEQILNSAVYKSAEDAVEKAILASILAVKYDGKPETDQLLVKYCLRLQDNRLMRAQLRLAVAQGQVEQEKFSEKKRRGWVL